MPDLAHHKQHFVKIRQLLVGVLSLLVFSLLIKVSWFEDRPSKSKSTTQQTASATSAYQQFEEKLLLFQTQIIIGTLDYFDKHSGGSYSSVGALRTSIIESFSHSFDSNQDPQLFGAPSDVLLLKKLIVAHHFNYSAQLDDLRNLLLRRVSDGTVSPLTMKYVTGKYFSATDRWLQELQSSETTEFVTESERDPVSIAQHIHKELGFFGALFLADTSVDQVAKKAWQKRIGSITRRVFHKMVVVSVLFLFFIVGSAISFAILAYIYVFRGLHFRFEQHREFPTFALIEIFVLYLAAMAFTPDLLFALKNQGWIENMLMANAIAIILLPLLLFWPRLSRSTFVAPFRAVGLQWTSIGRFLLDIITGPTVYLASWTVFSVVLVVYSLALSYFQINPEQGAHPIMPILVSSENSSTIWLIVILAVVIAPVVEEIMFRGVLYGWLRRFIGAKAAALCSGLIFASVHPQGLVGIVPLAFIGTVLAFLREWKGTLIPSMCAHACFNAGTILLVILFLR